MKLGCMAPENRVAEFAKAGADVISFHPEATSQPAAVVESIAKAGCAPGVVLNPSTPIALVEHLLERVDVVVVMLVSPGWGEPKYVDVGVRKIRQLVEACEQLSVRTPHIEVAHVPCTRIH